MELDEFGKKFGWAFTPWAILIAILNLLLINGTDLETIDLVLISIIFSLSYLFVWHEIRIRALEKEETIEENKTTRKKKRK